MLVKVYDNVWAGEQSGLELQWIVPAGGLGASVVVVCEFRTNE